MSSALQEDTEFDGCSPPLYFAGGLDDLLPTRRGVIDTNVHRQGGLPAPRPIELSKEKRGMAG